MTDPDSAPPAKPAAVRAMAPKCVRCGKPVEPRHRPFCSQRCADIDLGMWATGGYRIATDDQALGDDDADETGPAPKS